MVVTGGLHWAERWGPGSRGIPDSRAAATAARRQASPKGKLLTCAAYVSRCGVFDIRLESFNDSR